MLRAGGAYDRAHPVVRGAQRREREHLVERVVLRPRRGRDIGARDRAQRTAHVLQETGHLLDVIPCHLEEMQHRHQVMQRHVEVIRDPIEERPGLDLVTRDHLEEIPNHEIECRALLHAETAFVSTTQAGFGDLLRAVRTALGLSQDEFGARLGVWRRTLTRWEIHNEMPPVPQRKHIAASLSGAPSHLRAVLVRSLGLHESFAAPLAVAPAAPPAAPALLDGAFFALCERVDVSPARMRAAPLTAWP